MAALLERRIGNSSLFVPAIGMGCWAIGGPFDFYGRPDGWGDVDDAASVRAIEAAIELGARLFDSADAYGAGHSERLLGSVIKRRRADMVIATKFGFLYDEARKQVGGSDVTPAYIARALDASRRRLGVETIDLYQIHVGDLTSDQADAAAEALEDHVAAGRIRSWGWSTGDAAAAARMTRYPHFVAVQQKLNMFEEDPGVLALCDAHGLASLNRSPLAMGLLTGKFTTASALPVTDVRGAGHAWVPFFDDGRPDPKVLERLDALRGLLTTGGRTLAQGALGWNLARSPRTIPLPGFKSEAQVRENFGALEKGKLPDAVMAEIAALLARQ